MNRVDFHIIYLCKFWFICENLDECISILVNVHSYITWYLCKSTMSILMYTVSTNLLTHTMEFRFTAMHLIWICWWWRWCWWQQCWWWLSGDDVVDDVDGDDDSNGDNNKDVGDDDDWWWWRLVMMTMMMMKACIMFFKNK